MCTDLYHVYAISFILHRSVMFRIRHVRGKL